METATIEKVLRGVTYLLGAFSKFDFFSHLERFIADLYGPVRFSFLAGSPRGPARSSSPPAAR